METYISRLLIQRILIAIVLAVCVAGSSQQPGAPDPSFDAQFLPNARIETLALQPDGKILAGGSFALRSDGKIYSTLARLNQDGSLDSTFQLNQLVWMRMCAIQPDGKIIVAANPASSASIEDRRIVRLLPDGTIDASFRTASIKDSGGVLIEPTALGVQSDGKVIIGSAHIDFRDHKGIARLNLDGNFDANFSEGTGFDFSDPQNNTGGTINYVKVQQDDKIVVAGRFRSFNGVPRNGLARLNSDGSLEMGFDPATAIWERHGKANYAPTITALELASEGKLYVAVTGQEAGGQPYRSFVFRLTNDGQIDDTFTPTGTENGIISLLSIQKDGKILASGYLAEIAGIPCNNLARLLPDGGVDTTFAVSIAFAGPSPFLVTSLAPTDDGRILIGGWFKETDDFPHNGIARLFSSRQLPSTARIEVNPEPQNIQEAAQISLNVVVSGYPAPTIQWYFNDKPIAGETNRYFIKKRATFADAGRYYAMAMNSEGSAKSQEANITVSPVPVTPSAIDLSFQPADSPDLLGAYVLDLEKGENGSVYVGRTSTYKSGKMQDEIVKYFEDGSLASGYKAIFQGDRAYSIRQLIRYPDGRLLAAGIFRMVNGQTNHSIARLNLDGSVDTSFKAALENPATLVSIGIQPDGKIIFSGSFQLANRRSERNIVRLNDDGSIDPTFDATAVFDRPFPELLGFLEILEIAPTGEILLASRSSTMRLLSNGTPDPSFEFRPQGPDSRDLYTRLPNGRTLRGIGSSTLTQYDGTNTTTFKHMLRYQPNGELDTDFNIDADGRIYAFVVQPDQKIIIGGLFTTIDGVQRSGIARLDATGTLDPSFNPGPGIANPLSQGVRHMILDNDKVWIAGDFSHFNGVRVPGIARLHLEQQLALQQPSRSAHRFWLQAPTILGKTHILEFSDSFSGNHWTPVQTTIGTGTTMSFEDAQATGLQRFYRIRVE